MECLLRTEQRNPHTTHIDQMSTYQVLQVMNRENRRVTEAVEEVLPDLAPLIDAISENIERGGRLIYAGAGTSGRLAMADAAECPPTFGVPEGQVIALIAGGAEAMAHAVEEQEDDESAGYQDLMKLEPTPLDTVLGISAAGGAAYVMGALKAARQSGAVTACLCCNRQTPLESYADYAICPDTGPEVITGSTRLKAGTAQKLVLNMISTTVMIRTGKVYENYMVNMKPKNAKLWKRAIGMVTELANCSWQEGEAALKESGGDIRKAVEQLKERR